MTDKYRKPLLAANWKMNNTVTESLKFITVFTHELKAVSNVDIVICPPYTALYSTGIALTETDIKLGSQNIYWEDSGAYTGEVSGAFLADVGCEYVIVGHSERRTLFGETDKMISQKLSAVYRHGLLPILCVGENETQKDARKTWDVIEKQLNDDLVNIALSKAETLTIAYEPIWAIGTGKTATPDQAEEVHKQIRNYLSNKFDGATAEKIRILYGGSVKAKNSHEIMSKENIDGVLVGGASLDPIEFSQMIRSTV